MAMAVPSGRHPAFARLALIVAGACALALLGAPDGRAATVTIGSPLTGSYFQSTFSLTGTVANSTLPEPGANLTSPVTGAIVRWRIMDGSGGPYRLRVLTPGGATAYTGGAASDPETPAGTGVETFTTNLPIQAGQTIGLDNTNPTDGIGDSEFTGAANISWAPGLGLGETRVATGSSGNELSFNADVEYSPPVAPAPPSGSPPPVAKCVVPKLTGKSLKADRKRLVKAGCRLGKVKGRKSASARVTKQSPKPGNILPLGAKVSVKLDG
jgi:PASTA domain